MTYDTFHIHNNLLTHFHPIVLHLTRNFEKCTITNLNKPFSSLKQNSTHTVYPSLYFAVDWQKNKTTLAFHGKISKSQQHVPFVSGAAILKLPQWRIKNVANNVANAVVRVFFKNPCPNWLNVSWVVSSPKAWTFVRQLTRPHSRIIHTSIISMTCFNVFQQ